MNQINIIKMLETKLKYGVINRGRIHILPY